MSLILDQISNPLAAKKFPLSPILLVDDEKQLLKSMRWTLLSGGINNVILCDVPTEVQSIVDTQRPELVILDLRMPHISGIELLKILKEGYPTLPVIIMTADVDLGTAVKCMKLGAFDYLVKPVDGSKLIATVKGLLKINDLQKQNASLRNRLNCELAQIKRIEKEKVLAEVSRKYIQLQTTDIDRVVEESLQRVADFFELDRGYIFLFSRSGDFLHNSYEWCRQEELCMKKCLQRFEACNYSWCLEKLNDLQIIHSSLARLPPVAWKELKTLIPNGILSFIFVPLFIGNSLLGFLGFDSKKKRTNWSEDEFRFFKIFAEILVNSFVRKSATEELSENEERFRILVKTANEAIVIGNSRSEIISWNSAAEKIFGYCQEEVQGKILTNYIQLESTEEASVNDKILLTPLIEEKSSSSFQLWGLSKERGKIPLEVSVANWETKDGRFFTWIMRDISRRKKAEEQLMRANEEMEMRIERRTRQLAAAKEEAERANKAKSIILTNMSHEMRTPLHGILSFCEHGVNDQKKGKHEEVLNCFEIIKGNSERLLHLLNDLLDLAKLESGKMAFYFEKSDLYELCKTAVEETRPIFSKKGINIQLKKPYFSTVLDIDPKKIFQVIQNLLNNAIKFSLAEQKITFTFSQMDNELVLKICDEGMGVPHDELKAIFGKFIQSSRSDSGAGGTGLGLAICREILVGHQGKIWAKNNPDKGASFCFSLPLINR
ncbi:ATP-binding protein [Candidatus Riflebacteria bacterium]